MKPTVGDYIQAGYPCLFLPTVEPSVAEDRVKKAVQDLGLVNATDYGVWKATTGLMVGSANGEELDTKAEDDLLDALRYVEVREKPIVAVFHNVRHFVQSYQVIQQMVDTCMKARMVGSHIILVGPTIELPPELRPLVTYCECPLPTVEQIKNEYTRIVEAYADDLTLPASNSERQLMYQEAATAAVGLDMLGAESALALSLALKERVDIRIIQAQKEQEVRKSDVLEFIPADETMDDVGGYGALKQWLLRRQRAFTKEATDFGLPFPKGLLLVGVAGTGKSLSAKAVSHYLRLPCLRLDMGKIYRSLLGDSEAATRMALQVAEAVSPVVLWMDELDKGLAGMQSSGQLDGGVSARVVSTILTWRQETTKPVMLVATANDVTNLPSMVYRRGRFDEVFATDLPTISERSDIFAIHLKKRHRDPERYNISAMAAKADNFTGAEIESCIVDGMFRAFDEHKEVADAHIMEAIEETVPQAVRDKEEVQKCREWVKSRARLVSLGDEPVAKASVRKIKKRKAQ
jgi:ATP-dependent 26S proteasome regulatory subunit